MEKVFHGKKRRKFDASFKAEAVKLVNSGRSVSVVAQELGIGENLLYLWRNELNQNQPIESAALQSELESLRRQLKQTEIERDILKKAISILSPKT
ncbi:MAG: hypothetical protein EAZ67_14265 [Cytophagales bacterium]|nr:MAG: hypothetical protein EAZ67_14265 [Cytophagales bacterium]